MTDRVERHAITHTRTALRPIHIVVLVSFDPVHLYAALMQRSQHVHLITQLLVTSSTSLVTVQPRDGGASVLEVIPAHIS